MSDEQAGQATEQQSQEQPAASEADVLKAFETGKVPGEGQEQGEQQAAAPEPQKEEGQQQQNETFEANARLERQNRELQEQLKGFQELQEAAKESPSEALKKLGIDPLDYLSDLDDDPAPVEPVEEVKGEIKELKELLSKQQEELQKTRVDSFVEMKKKEIVDEAKASANSVPFAHMALQADPNFLNDIMQYAVGQAQESGQLPAPQELLKAADDHVVAAFTKRLETFLTAPGGPDKVRSALEKLTQQTGEQGSGDGDGQARTLTNEMSTDTQRKTNPNLSEEEAEAEFLRAMGKDGWYSGEDD